METPDLSYIGPSESKRMFCVTTIRRDARTGAVRVTVAGELAVAKQFKSKVGYGDFVNGLQ